MAVPLLCRQERKATGKGCPMLVGLLLFLAVGATSLAGCLVLYHVISVNRKPRRLITTNELGGLPPPPAPFVRVAPVDPDKEDWDSRFMAWKMERDQEALATITADDPDLYDILERAAERSRRHV